MKNHKTVKMNIHAGGAWEGHVVYVATHPQHSHLKNTSSNLDEVIAFCEKHDLLVDERFMELVKRKLVFETGKGFVISPEFLDERAIITSASKYLRETFGPEGYY